MIKYIKKDRNSSLLKFNTETQDIDTINYTNSNIDWLWIIDEDGELNGEPVFAGDIVIMMYRIDTNTDISDNILIVKDETLRNYYKKLTEYYKELETKQNNLKDSCAECAYTGCKAMA